jgi:predicted amidohydrolase
MYYIENKKNKEKKTFGKNNPEGEIFGLDSRVKGFVIVDRTYSVTENLPTFMLANINPSGMDIDYNIQRLKTIVEIAAQNRVNVLVLPELPVSGYVWDPENKNKEEVFNNLKKCVTDGPLVTDLIKYFRSLMTEDGLNLIIFNNIRQNGEKLYDTTYVIGQDNEYLSCYYDKIFLTPIEKKYFYRGDDQRLVVNTKYGKFGINICYDLVFNSLAEKYAYDDKVDAIINSAAWRRGSIREYPLLNIRMDNYYQYIWDLKHAALASHNQVWSIGVTCVGVFDRTGNSFAGGSGFWSPSGICMCQASKTREELLIMRNLDITKHMRNQAVEDFNYALDYNEVWRQVENIKPKIKEIK